MEKPPEQIDDQADALSEEIEQISSVSAPVPFDPLKRYLMEIKAFPLLTREEEIQLAIRYREKGDTRAAYRLVTGNLRLVVKIALEFHHQWMVNLLDLIQEGNIGLMHAVKKFDPYRGVKLSYYASYWIRAYILRFIMDNWKLVKIGTTQTQRRLFFNLQKEKRKLEEMGFYPGPKRLAQSLNTTEGKIIEMEQRLGDWEPSLDQAIGDEWKETRGGFISDDSEPIDRKLAREELKELFTEKLHQFKNSLTGKELEILEKRLLADEPETLSAIGDRYGISKERVRQLEERLKKKIRHYIEEEIPDFEEKQLQAPKNKTAD